MTQRGIGRESDGIADRLPILHDGNDILDPVLRLHGSDQLLKGRNCGIVLVAQGLQLYDSPFVVIQLVPDFLMAGRQKDGAESR